MEKFDKEPLCSLILKVVERCIGVKSAAFCFTNRPVQDLPMTSGLGGGAYAYARVAENLAEEQASAQACEILNLSQTAQVGQLVGKSCYTCTQSSVA